MYSLENSITRTNDVFICAGQSIVKEFHVEFLIYFLVSQSHSPAYTFKYSK